MRRQCPEVLAARCWIRVISQCWRAFNNIGQNSPRRADRSFRITASDRAISASARRRGTNLGIAGSLSAATFPRIIWISCMRRPSVIHDRSPFY